MNRQKKKVLLMGKSGSGKTSMRSIIFANYIARDTRRLGATIEVEHSQVRFLGNLHLNLWDCGGQDLFMENYITNQRDSIFRDVEVLIYVFDVQSPDIDKDIQYYRTCLDAIQSHSPNAKIFCLVHKMDLVSPDQQEVLFKTRSQELVATSLPLAITTFKTSIWDESLYRAWSAIVYALIPHIKTLEQNLNMFVDICEADEVVLFERTTFLFISHVTRRPNADTHRFEKISNIIKQFKLCCGKSQTQFGSMEVRNGEFAAFIESLTANTYVMVVLSDTTVQSAAMLLNIAGARKQFKSGGLED